MNRLKDFSFILLVLICFSCKNSQEEQITTTQKPLLSIAKKHPLPVTIKSGYEKNIESWEEYQSLKSFLERYVSISPNDALNNALELKLFVEGIKSTSRPKVLNIDPFNARVHLLYNEVLRLADMTYISAITPKEVNEQVAKVLEAYAAVNRKINAIYARKDFENSVETNAFFMGIDTSKIGRMSIKSMKIIDKDLQLEKNPKKRSRKKLKQPLNKKQ